MTKLDPPSTDEVPIDARNPEVDALTRELAAVLDKHALPARKSIEAMAYTLCFTAAMNDIDFDATCDQFMRCARALRDAALALDDSELDPPWFTPKA